MAPGKYSVRDLDSPKAGKTGVPLRKTPPTLAEYSGMAKVYQRQTLVSTGDRTPRHNVYFGVLQPLLVCLSSIPWALCLGGQRVHDDPIQEIPGFLPPPQKKNVHALPRVLPTAMASDNAGERGNSYSNS